MRDHLTFNSLEFLKNAKNNHVMPPTAQSFDHVMDVCDDARCIYLTSRVLPAWSDQHRVKQFLCNNVNHSLWQVPRLWLWGLTRIEIVCISIVLCAAASKALQWDMCLQSTLPSSGPGPAGTFKSIYSANCSYGWLDKIFSTIFYASYLMMSAIVSGLLRL